ncbi:hypothetical protein OURE66S_01237 [Oligella ureolytica]
MVELKNQIEFIKKHMNVYGFADDLIKRAQTESSDSIKQLDYILKNGSNEKYKAFITEVENLYGEELGEY